MFNKEKIIYVITAVARGLDQSGEPEIIGSFTNFKLALAAFELFVSEVQPSEAQADDYYEYRNIRDDGTIIYGIDEWEGDYHLVVKLIKTDLCTKKV